MGASLVAFADNPTINNLGFESYPITSSLKDLFWLGTDEASSEDNQVSGRSNATMAGMVNAVVIASITSNVMNVTAVTSGVVWLGMDIGGGRRVLTLGTGTGGTGTYTVSAGDDVASTTITCTPYHDGYVSFGDSLTANRMPLATTDNEFSQRTYIAVCRHLGPLTSSSDWRAAIGHYGGTTSGMALFQNVATLGNGALRTVGIGVPTPPQAQFQFIAAAYTSADKTMRTYYGRDGVLYASGEYSDATGFVGSGAPVIIGANATIGSNKRVLEVAMAAQHDAPLSLSDIQKIYIYTFGRLIADHALDVA